MTDNITVSRELLRQAIEALNEADNVLTSSMFAEAANALRAELEQVQQPGEVCARCGGLVYDPVLDVTDGDVEYKHVCNLWMDEKTLNYEIDRCERPSSELIPAYIKTQQPAPVREAEKLNPLTQLQVAYVMGLRDAQPRKAVKLSDSEILAALEVEYVSSAQNRHLFLSDARTIEAAVWAKLGVEP